MIEASPQNVAVVVIGVLACITDFRSRRIPNVLTFGASAAAIVFFGLTNGWAGSLWSLAGWAVGCGLFLPWFLLGGMGAGDVKLLAALGAWMGPVALLPIVLLSSVVGAIIGGGLILLARRGREVPMPFGPYIAIAGWVWLVAGDKLLASYMSFAGLH